MGGHPPITLNLKDGIRTSDYQSSQTPPKFTRSSFQCIHYIPLGHGLQTLPCGLWGVVILKYIIPRPWKYFEQNGYLKILYWECLGKWWSWKEGLVVFQSLSTMKSAPAISISNWMSSFQNFYDSKQPSKSFYQMAFGKMWGCGGGYPPSDQFES